MAESLLRSTEISLVDLADTLYGTDLLKLTPNEIYNLIAKLDVARVHLMACAAQKSELNNIL